MKCSMKRKVQFCVLMTLLLTALNANPVFAYVLGFESFSDVQDNTVRVNIYAELNQGENLQAASFNVFYDPSVLQYLSSGYGSGDFEGVIEFGETFIDFFVLQDVPVSGPASYQLGFIQFAVLDTSASSTMVTFEDVILYAGGDSGANPISSDLVTVDAASGEVNLSSPAAPVPLPPTLLLMGSGLIALATQRRRFKK